MWRKQKARLVCNWWSLSEPYIDKLAINFLHIYICMSCCKSIVALILCLWPYIIHYTKWTPNNSTSWGHLLDGNNKDGDHLWTYLFSGWSDRTTIQQHIFYLSMPIFQSQSSYVEASRYVDQPPQWLQRWGQPNVKKEFIQLFLHNACPAEHMYNLCWTWVQHAICNVLL